MKEDILFRKLLADGEGTGEERRFQILCQMLRGIRSSPNAVDAAKAIRQIELMELSIHKQLLISRTCADETSQHVNMIATIDNEILESRDRMCIAKNELLDARLVRRNKQEYSVLAKVIDDVPSRKDSNRKLEDIQEELNQQHDRQRTLELKLAERRNHLHAFNIILANFQKFLNDDDECEPIEDGSDTVESHSKEASNEPMDYTEA